MFPIAGSFLSLMFSKIHSRFRDYLAVASVGTGALFSFSMIPDVLAGNISPWQISWFHLELGVLIDPLSVLMACVINGIGLLVTVFSVEYMRRDPSLSRYWFLIQLFIGGLVLVVVADNLLLLFIGWEIVGVSCSALVAFWHQDPEKAHYGLKTFLVLRVGDILLLMSILIIFAYSNTFNLWDLQQNGRWIVDLSNSGLLLITVMMLFGGAIAKSALFPLHVWLPDALPASPASFNALTEVLAGAFLVSRFLPMLHASTAECMELAFFFSTVAWIGAFTALFAALMAVVERNVIRVLVYSIISQYAFVMVGLGVGGLMENPAFGYIAANMHLMVDAVSSALLFLCAASLLYATGSQNMFGMPKQIRSKMPTTFKCMAVGALALMGIPPLSGFWSEEAISGTTLKLAHEASVNGQYLLAISALGLYALLLMTTVITAFFTVRMMGLVFGKGKSERVLEKKTINEVPATMWIPMSIAALVTVLIGVFAPFIILGFREFFSPILLDRMTHGGLVDIIKEALFSPATAVTGAALLVGILPAHRLYVKRTSDPIKLIETRGFLKKAYGLLWNRFYIDALYYKFAYGAVRLSQAGYRYLEMEGIEKLEFSGFGEVYHDMARWAESFSHWIHAHIELKGFDAFNYSFAKRMAVLSQKLRKTHTGVLSYNMLSVFLGIVLLSFLLLFLGGFF